jgi:hypothetical protein
MTYTQDKIKIMEVLNPNWDINAIVTAYNSQNFNLLQNSNDKIAAVANLIVDSLPTTKILNAMEDDKRNELSNERIAMIKNQIILERLYVTSLLSDAISSQKNPLTTLLKLEVSENLPSSENIKKEENEIVSHTIYSKDDVLQALANNVNKIADALQLRQQQKSFIEKLGF